MPTTFDFRRTVTALALCVCWAPPLALLAYVTERVGANPRVLGSIAMGLIVLVAIVFAGLSLSVAMRQVGFKLGTVDFSATGGCDDAGNKPGEE